MSPPCLLTFTTGITTYSLNSTSKVIFPLIYSISNYLLSLGSICHSKYIFNLITKDVSEKSKLYVCPLTVKNNNNKERVILLHSSYSGIFKIMFNTASSAKCSLWSLRINDSRQ